MATNLHAFIPKYLTDPDDVPGRHVVSSTEWNNLWDLIVTQGNYSEETLLALLTKLNAELWSENAAVTIANPEIGSGSGNTVASQLAWLKAYCDAVDAEVATKASQVAFNALQTLVNTKANTTDVNAALATKASVAALNTLQNLVNTNNTNTTAALATKADAANVYTKAQVFTKTELEPFLAGGDTSLKYEVFTIINANNGDGTFTYTDLDSVLHTGELTVDGYQVFTLQEGSYQIGLNRIEVFINDTLHRSQVSGGLLEIDAHTFALTIPEGNGAEITVKYFERIDLAGEHNIIYSEAQPVYSTANTMWFKKLT